MKRSIKYQDELIKDLKNKDEAIAYLNAALEESQKGDAESQHLFLLALRNVTEAQGGIGKLAKKSHIGRESLYKMLSEKGNPTWNTLITLFNSLGLNFRLVG
jgi:probable addiction module antidote protein